MKKHNWNGLKALAMTNVVLSMNANKFKGVQRTLVEEAQQFADILKAHLLLAQEYGAAKSIVLNLKLETDLLVRRKSKGIVAHLRRLHADDITGQLKAEQAFGSLYMPERAALSKEAEQALEPLNTQLRELSPVVVELYEHLQATFAQFMRSLKDNTYTTRDMRKCTSAYKSLLKAEYALVIRKNKLVTANNNLENAHLSQLLHAEAAQKKAERLLAEAENTLNTCKERFKDCLADAEGISRRRVITRVKNESLPENLMPIKALLNLVGNDFINRKSIQRHVRIEKALNQPEPREESIFDFYNMGLADDGETEKRVLDWLGCETATALLLLEKVTGKAIGSAVDDSANMVLDASLHDNVALSVGDIQNMLASLSIAIETNLDAFAGYELVSADSALVNEAQEAFNAYTSAKEAEKETRLAKKQARNKLKACELAVRQRRLMLAGLMRTDDWDAVAERALLPFDQNSLCLQLPEAEKAYERASEAKLFAERALQRASTNLNAVEHELLVNMMPEHGCRPVDALLAVSGIYKLLKSSIHKLELLETPQVSEKTA